MSGEVQLLDLADSLFWVVALVAALLLAPIVDARLRGWVWAAVNLGAIAVLLGLQVLAGGLAIAAGVWAAARALVGPGRRGSFFFVASLAAVLGLFLVHKLDLPEIAALGPAKTVLVGIGFSYVALRATELLRAIWEARHPPPSLHDAINYLLPFHMLAAGPIQAYDEFAAQSIPARRSRRATLEAVERITLGLFKKFVVSYLLAATMLTGFTADGAYTLVEIQAFYLWVYLDFSAYTDIAVGLGRLMGVATPENFDRPLSARNITVFWERWHISLSLFIRRNLFIPVQLGLVRRYPRVSPMLSASLAFSVAFLLCGLWHEVSLRFLLWGGMHALGLIVCNLYRIALKARLGARGVRRYMEIRPVRWLATAITFEFVAFSIAFALYPGSYWWE